MGGSPSLVRAWQGLGERIRLGRNPLPKGAEQVGLFRVAPIGCRLFVLLRIFPLLPPQLPLCYPFGSLVIEVFEPSPEFSQISQFLCFWINPSRSLASIGPPVSRIRIQPDSSRPRTQRRNYPPCNNRGSSRRSRKSRSFAGQWTGLCRRARHSP